MNRVILIGSVQVLGYRSVDMLEYLALGVRLDKRAQPGTSSYQ